MSRLAAADGESATGGGKTEPTADEAAAVAPATARAPGDAAWAGRNDSVPVLAPPAAEPAAPGRAEPEPAVMEPIEAPPAEVPGEVFRLSASDPPAPRSAPSVTFTPYPAGTTPASRRRPDPGSDTGWRPVNFDDADLASH